MRNVPPAISHQLYNDINLSPHIVYEKAAKESILAVVKDLKENLSENLGHLPWMTLLLVLLGKTKKW